MIIFVAAVLVSLLVAGSMTGFAALTKSLAWSVAGAVLVAVLVSWIFGFLMWRRSREPPLHRLVLGPLVVLGLAAVLSVSWLYPGFAAIYRDSTPALFCDKRWRTRLEPPVSATTPTTSRNCTQIPPTYPLHLDRLAMIKVAVLVIKPACDYLPWSATAGYPRAFPQAQVVMIPDAGHVAYLEQPALYTRLVQAFLSGQQLSLPTLDGAAVPDSYRGTR